MWVRNPALAATVCLVAVIACRAPALAAEGANPRSPDPTRWSLVEHPDAGLNEIVIREAGGAVGAICAGEQCGIFVEPKSACLPGNAYPILVNSARFVGVLRSQCFALKEPARLRFVVKLQEEPSLLASIVRGEMLSFAFPAESGPIDVLRVDTAGLQQRLAELMGAAAGAGEGEDGAPASVPSGGAGQAAPTTRAHHAETSI